MSFVSRNHPQQVMAEALPDWADEWLADNCGCGAKLVTVYGWGGAHAVCSESGWTIEKCPKVLGRKQ